MGSLKHNAQHIVCPQLYFSSRFSPTHLACSQGGEQRGRQLFPVALSQGNIDSVIKAHAQKWKYLVKTSEL